MPHPDHELQDPQERKYAANILRMFRRAPKRTVEWLRYERARLVQDRRRSLKLCATQESR